MLQHKRSSKVADGPADELPDVTAFHASRVARRAVEQLKMDGIAILLWSADPDAPARLATPFFHAAAAAAMDTPVEIYFSAKSVLLLEPGVAETLRASERHEKTVLDAMREAAEHGAVFYACPDALAAHGLDSATLIPLCTRRGGAVQFMARVCDPAWRTLVF